MPATKIATCCYCGTRAALRLAGRERHELACASCGAPLHAMKMLPIRDKDAPPLKRDPHHHDVKKSAANERLRSRGKPKKPKKRKGMIGFLVSEIWDEIEDIFD